MIGSDQVVKSYNNLMQHFYDQEGQSQESDNHSKKGIELLGQFLLEIRKSMGNESSKLVNWDMLEWFITDARKLRKDKLLPFP